MKVGPNISQTGLVFGMDIGNHRYYPGEPTTNLLPNATTNAIPKLGNAWGTYNTNQYGSGNFFSIGTVSSVSNNIVTMSLAHSLRTYDVMRPQTTGGGVTANTDYFIKRVSSTQFSLHTYNGSQDGSQGYINVTTGMHKVHDSIANDTRISISAENFPTMWWGAPHLPNSGLVKEIIPNGFTNPLTGEVTDCIRQHITRDSGADHMAYGVDANFTPNSPVYCSFWARSVDAAAVGRGINYYHYTYGIQSPTSYAVNCTLGPVGVWQRFGYTFTSPNSYAISYWFNPDGPYKYDIANIQIEQKDHPTRFTTGSRSSTQSILDISKNTTINVSNVSFDSNGFPTFDGTDDYIYTTNNVPCNFGTGDFTAEVMIYPQSFSNYTHMVALPTQSTFALKANVSDGAIYYYDPSFSTYGSTPGWTLTLNQWNHVVLVRQNNVAYTYLNGVSYGSKSGFNTNFSSAQVANIGWGWGGEYTQKKINVVRLYNKALNEREVLQNFSSYKRRFGI